MWIYAYMKMIEQSVRMCNCMLGLAGHIQVVTKPTSVSLSNVCNTENCHYTGDIEMLLTVRR